MILSFHGATTMTSDLETDVKISSQAGFIGLEVWYAKIEKFLKIHSIDELKALFADYKIKPVALDALEFVGFRGSEFELIQTRCREMCSIARAIGCPTVAVVPSPSPDVKITWSETVDEYVTVLRNLSDIAAEYGIQLAFEFLGFGWCSVRTPRAAWEIIRKTDRKNVGMVIDTAHFYGGGGLMNELDSLDGKRIFALHLDDLEDTPKEAITDGTRLFPGQGVVPLNDICTRLKNIGYDGHCSIELFRPEYWTQDPLYVAQQAKIFALQILLPYFNVETSGF
ncbi:MAG: isomerase [Chloroflexi bacterium HGW-Chloroflexi-10]|nr:MAG: isomerase [Chloroflexi bacterium HGW-Chloroflexi-10]